MSASEHLHPKQLSMFMPARELYKMNPNPTDLMASNTTSSNPEQRKNDMWTEKLSESKEKAGSVEGWRSGGLHDSIAKQGVLEPVRVKHSDVGESYIADGHHRVAAAHDINPNMEIPVEHYVPSPSPKQMVDL